MSKKIGYDPTRLRQETKRPKSFHPIFSTPAVG